jgi:hypothetical protein
MIKDPIYKTGFDRNVWIWEKAIDGESYLLSADVARGDGRDYSVFHVFKLSTMEIVCEYRGKVTPDIFSRILFDSASEYNGAMLVVENNSVGYAVLDKLIEMDYQNIYYSIKSTHEYVDQYLGEQQSNAVPGFTMSLKTRPIIISKLEEFVRNKLAMRSYNDDLTIACAIGCWVRDTALMDNKKAIEYRKAFLNTMTKSNTMLNTTIKGMSGYNDTSLSDAAKHQKKTMNDYPWLFKG